MICKKANSSLVFLRRNLYHCQRNVKVDTYQTYLRPILEYAVTAWTLHTQWNINKLNLYSTMSGKICFVRLFNLQ